MNKEKSYGAVVVKRHLGQWQILLIQHARGGHWSFPKGHPEPHESIEETIYREVEEETGLIVELDPIYDYRSCYQLPDGTPKEVFYYLARPKSEILVKREGEISSLGWFDFEEAKEILTYEEDKCILSQLFEDLQQASLLEKAIEIALNAHAGQLDKSGISYVLHPLRVMLSLSDETDQICAVLHDVVEDSPITLSDLKEAGFPREVVETVGLLTRRDTESYDEYISRILLSDRACRIKLMDLKDNMSRTPFDKGNPSYEERTARYTRARNRILSRMQDKGSLL